MRTRDHLVRHIASGGAADLFFFWGHTPKRADVVDKSCLSQWFHRAFNVDGVTYATAEHFMMAGKARLFGDDASVAAVLSAATPADAKARGRGVRDYDDARWAAARYDHVVNGNVAKFTQHADLAAYLVATGDKVLVEASPSDRVWGIALSASAPEAMDPTKWRGENLLGFALMEVRARLVHERGRATAP
jgi:ribA/ribD-fused uncharacterized protein